ncbi:1534_t:CDS:1 [Cetraspora pellucida]|uniref:1534_t:CDS:1 n=1 Tax=Cetraspora pellucida TaxID=1433469 RepID=A0A9N9JCK2_9GLOM|nr:1534_t:CDS:1 [Cetraspora pellucida]
MTQNNNNTIDLYQTYLSLKKNQIIFDGYFSDLSLYKETLEKMKKNGFSVDTILTQVCAEIEINKNLLNDSKDNISKFEKNIRNFSLLIIVNEDKKVWISQRINPFKDYYNKWQVVGGGKNSNESYMDCAIREAKEEAGVDIKLENLKIISTIEGFRVFPDSEGQQILYRTVIYYTITNQILQHTEKDNHSEWILVDLKKLVEYDMTDSIKEHMSIILEVINKKFRAIRTAESKKRSAARRKHKEIESAETEKEILVVKNGVVKTKKQKKIHKIEEKVTNESSSSEDENVESSSN